MAQIQIYSSLPRRKEPLPEPQKGKPLRLFVCGPTTYDDAHIGHARTYIFFDFFVKYLRSQGVNTEYVQNITDIDDKIIQRAKAEKKDPLELADYFTKRYLEDMKELGINSVDHYAPATKFIPQIVKQVQTLIKKGFAYEIPGDGWYFDVSKFRDYGKLSGRTAEQAEDAVSRIDESVQKRNRGDFCLWKFSKPGEPSWQSPLGEGRPGWHIEDTAISEHYFGPQYEIHGGGLDLKFPHHEAEIAQQEAASGKSPFVQIWMHTEMVTVNGQKMSKSLGNFVTIRDFLQKKTAQNYMQSQLPDIMRIIFFSMGHYRTPLDYNDKAFSAAEKLLDNLNKYLAKMASALKNLGVDKPKSNGAAEKVVNLLEQAKKDLPKVLNDDLNTPKAMAILFPLFVAADQSINWGLDKALLDDLDRFLRKSLSDFGIEPKTPEIPMNINKLFESYKKFRGNQQFDHSNPLRDKLEELGYIVEDAGSSSFIWPKHQN